MTDKIDARYVELLKDETSPNLRAAIRDVENSDPVWDRNYFDKLAYANAARYILQKRSPATAIRNLKSEPVKSGKID